MTQEEKSLFKIFMTKKTLETLAEKQQEWLREFQQDYNIVATEETARASDSEGQQNEDNTSAHAGEEPGTSVGDSGGA